MASQYTTLNAIVKRALGDREETNHLYAAYMRHAIKGYREFHFDHSYEIQTKILEMNSYNAVDLPCDYVDWIKIGVPLGDRIKEFSPGKNINLINPIDEFGDEVANHLTDSLTPLPYHDFYQANGNWFGMYVNDKGEHLGKQFGRGDRNSLGYFEIKKEREQIQFTSDVNCKYIYIEYINDGINPSGGTLVHKYAALAIELWIHWRVAKFRLGSASAEALESKQEYYNQIRICKARNNPLTPDMIVEIANKNYKSSIK